MKLAITHPEWLYLLKQAHFIFLRSEECAKQNAEYHASDHFYPLVSGGEAQLRIARPAPEDAPWSVLRVRHSDGDDPDPVAAALEEPKKVGSVAYKNKVETVFVSKTVPSDPYAQ